MSYFNYPRLTFGGRFKASPSTLNNTPNNYDPAFYPTPNALKKVELYWNPRGDGGFALVDCVVTRVDYQDGSFSVTPEEDPIVGQPVTAIQSPAFPLQAALVDLDPMQQNVSEIWAMTLQIGGASANFVGNFTAISFNSIWGQAQGQQAPHSSASGAGVYQSTLSGLRVTGETKSSRFLQWVAENSAKPLSINFNLSAHNNSPPVFRFDADSFTRMQSAGVPSSVLAKLPLMQSLMQMNQPSFAKGDVPTQDFVVFMLKQLLSTDEYNANVDLILNQTALPYQRATTEEFLYGLISGSIGPANAKDPRFFVPTRVLAPFGGSTLVNFAPFVVTNAGRSLQLNLGNSLPVEFPGKGPWVDKLGSLWLVAFTNGSISAEQAHRIIQIPYDADGFMTSQAGMFTAALDADYSQTPLGLVSVLPGDAGGAGTLLLAENINGYSLRADQFVFRMNPGIPSTSAFPRGEKAVAEIHALKFGLPVPDGTLITVSIMNPQDALSYTIHTPGTSGALGVKNVSVPQDKLTINGQLIQATAATTGGVARFELVGSSPGNPRSYVDGQVYFLNYNFSDLTIKNSLVQDANDLLSVLVFDNTAELSGPDLLAKWGRLYKIMSFLSDPSRIQQIDLRNMIKVLLEKPFTELEHMPVTRDLSDAARAKIVSWIDSLNNS